MARYSLGERMTSAPTSTLPGMSLYSPAGSGFKLREVWLVNTTSTACQVALRRLSTTGTQGAAITESEYDLDAQPVLATAFQSHSVGPTITAGSLALASLGAAVGAAVVWSFGDTGIVVASGTGNGVGILTPTGTGQICDVTFVWDE